MRTIFTILFFFCINGVIAQKIYIDPVTTFALKGYSNSIKRGQNKTVKEQSKLRKAQAFLHLQMKRANDIQKKVYTGLKEVSGTLQNGIQLKQIYSEISYCHRYSSRIMRLIRGKPHYAVFGAKVSEKTYEQLLKIGSEITGLLDNSEKSLATAGDRYKILFRIESEIKQLKLWLISAYLTIERAIRIGFWKSLNPLQKYINTDKALVKNILRKYKHNF